MNGRQAKKIRKLTAINFGTAAAAVFKDLLTMGLWQRVRFSWAVLFKRKWRYTG